MSIASESPQFGSLLAKSGPEKRVWWFVIPAILALGALIVAAGVAISRASGLESQVKLAQQQVADAQKTVEERDKLLQKARVDEELLRSAGRGAAVLGATSPDSPASGVAVYHPANHAVKLYVFGLQAPPAGQEYRVEVVAGDERKAVGAIAPDERGSAFLLAKDVPEAATEIAVRVAPAGESKQGTPPATDARQEAPLLTGTLPKTGESGVVEAPPRVQARAPATKRRR
jgi:hypothetical protein